MNYLKFCRFLKEDFEISNSKFPSIRFFRSELILIFIWFWVLERFYEKKEYYIESLIQEIPEGFASRPTIFKFIELAISKGFLQKKSDNNDRRKFYLTPSDITVKEFEEWAKGFKGF